MYYLWIVTKTIFMLQIYQKKRFLIVFIVVLLLFVLATLVISFHGKLAPSNNKPAFESGATAQCFGPPYPSQSIDLLDWKLTLPILTDGKKSAPLEVMQPQLATYKNCPWFMLSPDGKGVVFRAAVNAPTTSNSDYPRSELREMTDGGTQEEFWSTSTGIHTLFMDEAITSVPKNKPDVVAGQIHGDDDDLIVIRLEYPKLMVSRGKNNLYTLDENYSLGKRFTIKFMAENGKIAVYYNNSANPVYTLDKKVKQAYFKAGVYTQSNCQTEESVNLCKADNYGEVTIYQLQVTHQQ